MASGDASRGTWPGALVDRGFKTHVRVVHARHTHTHTHTLSLSLSLVRARARVHVQAQVCKGTSCTCRRARVPAAGRSSPPGRAAPAETPSAVRPRRRTAAGASAARPASGAPPARAGASRGATCAPARPWAHGATGGASLMCYGSRCAKAPVVGNGPRDRPRELPSMPLVAASTWLACWPQAATPSPAGPANPAAPPRSLPCRPPRPRAPPTVSHILPCPAAAIASGWLMMPRHTWITPTDRPVTGRITAPATPGAGDASVRVREQLGVSVRGQGCACEHARACGGVFCVCVHTCVCARARVCVSMYVHARA